MRYYITISTIMSFYNSIQFHLSISFIKKMEYKITLYTESSAVWQMHVSMFNLFSIVKSQTSWKNIQVMEKLIMKTHIHFWVQNKTWNSLIKYNT